MINYNIDVYLRHTEMENMYVRELIELVTNDYNGNVFNFTIYDKDQVPYDLTGKKVTLIVKSELGTVIEDNCTILEATMGKANIIVPSDMFCEKGTYYAEIQIWQGLNRITSLPFDYTVRLSMDSDEAVKADNRFSLLQQALKDVNDSKVIVEQAKATAEDAFATANQAVTTINNEISKVDKAVTDANTALDRATSVVTKTELDERITLDGETQPNFNFIGEGTEINNLSVGESTFRLGLQEDDIFVRKNLFNKNDEGVGLGTVNYTNGTIGPHESRYHTGYIPVKQNTQYSYKNFIVAHFAFYDKDKKYIYNATNSLPNPFTTPVNACYFRASILSIADLETAQMNEGATLLEYQPYSNQYIPNSKIVPTTVIKSPNGINVSGNIIAKKCIYLQPNGYFFRVNSKLDNDNDLRITFGRAGANINSMPNIVGIGISQNSNEYPSSDFSSSEAIVFGSGTDWLGPYIVKAINNGDVGAVEKFSGGWHGTSGGIGGGEATASNLTFEVFADNMKLQNDEKRYCEKIKAVFTNRIQAYNTYSTKRNVLYEKYVVEFIDDFINVECEIEAKEDIEIKTYYGHQVVLGGIKTDGVARFYDAIGSYTANDITYNLAYESFPIASSLLAGQTMCTSGNMSDGANCNTALYYSLEKNIALETKMYDFGLGRYMPQIAKHQMFITSANKAYYNLINGNPITLKSGQKLAWRGYYKVFRPIK